MKIKVDIGYTESTTEHRWVELELTENGIVYTSEDCQSIEVIQRLMSFVPNRFAKYELVYAEYSVTVKQITLYQSGAKSNIKVHPTTLRWERIEK